MKLDRNIPENNGRGKYALLKARELPRARRIFGEQIDDALLTLEAAGLVEWGIPETPDEFFVLKLRDEFAGIALLNYAICAAVFDLQYAMDVRDLALRAGPRSPHHKWPD